MNTKWLEQERFKSTWGEQGHVLSYNVSDFNCTSIHTVDIIQFILENVSFLYSSERGMFV